MTRRRRRNNRGKGALLKAGFFCYLAICLFSTIWLKTSIVGLEYELGKYDELKADLIRDRKVAAAQRASYYSSEKVEGVAIKRLGMTFPDRENVYFVKRTSAAGPFRASAR